MLGMECSTTRAVTGHRVTENNVNAGESVLLYKHSLASRGRSFCHDFTFYVRLYVNPAEF